MASIEKIVLAFVIVQASIMALAKPHEPEIDDGLYHHSNDDMDDFVYKRGGTCSVKPENRKNCGYPGISRQDCERRGCCFNNSIRDTIWCFKTADCGSRCTPRGCFSFRCRSSCKEGESPTAQKQEVCSEKDQCCVCNERWGDCVYDN